MCYYIYGALSGEIDKNEYHTIEDKYEYKIRNGTKHLSKYGFESSKQKFRADPANQFC